MENEDMKQCPYCAEMIKASAIKCRYCGSTLTGKDTSSGSHIPRIYWARVNRGKRLAGVCTGIAREFNVPKLILPFRLFFILTTILSGFGLILYIALWLLMPAPVDRIGESSTEVFQKDSEGNELAETGTRKKVKPLDALLGLLLIAVGIILFLAAIGKDGFWGIPIITHFNLPGFIHDIGIFSFTWVPGLFGLLILLGLFLIFLGALKFFRIILGCGFIAIGSLFLILFIPFLPVFFFHGLLLIGIILMVIGFLKLVFGSTKDIPLKSD